MLKYFLFWMLFFACFLKSCGFDEPPKAVRWLLQKRYVFVSYWEMNVVFSGPREFAKQRLSS